jgi:hypothetical protein
MQLSSFQLQVRQLPLCMNVVFQDVQLLDLAVKRAKQEHKRARVKEAFSQQQTKRLARIASLVRLGKAKTVADLDSQPDTSPMLLHVMQKAPQTLHTFLIVRIVQ